MKKAFKYLLGIMMFSALFLIGCGGSSNDKQILESERPDAAVIRIANEIRASAASPRKADGNPEKQVLKLYDLAGNVYALDVADITKTDLDATVTCYFTYGTGSKDVMTIIFGLVFDEGKWWFEEVKITDGGNPNPPPTPTEDGVEGYVKDASGAAISGAMVQAFSVKDLNTVVNYTTTDSTGKYQLELDPGDYLLVATKDGYTLGSVSITVPSEN